MNTQKSLQNKVVDLIFNNIKIILLLFVFLVSFGLATFTSIPRSGFPEVLVNIASVSVPYPNATASAVESSIIKPLENVIKDIDGISEYSTTSSDNIGIAVVTIDQDANLNDVLSKLTAEVNQIKFPEDALKPSVNKFDAGGTGDIMVGVTGIDDVFTLFDVAAGVQDDLASVDGVKSVVQVNPLTPEVEVSFRQSDLERYNLSRSAIEQTLMHINFSAPIGSIEGVDKSEVNLSLTKGIDSLSELQNFVAADGVKLSDVANVSTVLNNNDHYNRIGFRESSDIDSNFLVRRAITLSIESEKGSDLLQVEEDIKEAIANIQSSKKYGDDLQVITLYSMADATRLQINEIKMSLFGSNIESLGGFGFLGYIFGGLTLVVLLLFMFMNFRVAVMAALAIPLSLFTATIYLSFLGIGLNTLVLFSMILAIGLVVDPTIVFLESMQRYKEQGFGGRESAYKTMTSVGVGITLAVATNIIVFVPFGIVSGFFGEIIKYIPVTVVPAMLASLVIPVLFFMPIASKVLKPRKKIESDINPELIGVWSLAKSVGKTVQWTLQTGKKFALLRVMIVVLSTALPVLLIYGMTSSGAIEMVQFSIPDDADAIFIQGGIENAMNFDDAVYNVVVPIQDLLSAQPEIKDFSYLQQEGNSFFMFMNLFPISVREDRGMRTAYELMDDLNVAVEDMNLPGDIFILSDGAGPGAEEFAVHVRVLGNDSEVLANASKDIQAYLLSLDGVKEVKDNVSDVQSGGSVEFKIKNDDVLTRNPFMVYGLIKDRVSDNELGHVVLNNLSYDVVSTIVPALSSVDDVYSIPVFTATKNVPLEVQPGVGDVTVGDIVVSATAKDAETIARVNGKRYIEISASISDDVTALDIQNQLDSYLTEEKLLELGLAENATDFKGEADSITQSFTELGIALLVAILLIYLLLVLFFRSYLEPFIILFAIPLGMIGVVLAVWLTTGQLGFLEILGVVAMAGIVVNVTILLLDFANQQLKNGDTPSQAIVTAVAVRFRPIVLTQLTAFGSMIPLVFISPFWKGLAASIIFGIASSALLSLFVTPVLYVWVHKIGRSMKGLPRVYARLKVKIGKLSKFSITE